MPAMPVGGLVPRAAENATTGAAEGAAADDDVRTAHGRDTVPFKHHVITMKRVM
ncbi:hypothetical protein [Kitasatospora sp. NPDC056800]|uniref:hypothetical protein n=1 Tax=Kitasatospora sp. NPDC056800 TaxID=3345948 RepID=UPI0036CEC815